MHQVLSTWKLNAFTCFAASSWGERIVEVDACGVQLVYGIGMELTCKLAPRSMHQVIGIGAALCAWLASHPEVLPHLKLFEVLANLQEALTFCIHRIPHIPKALAMWALSLIHVLLLSRFSAPTLESRKWRNRLFFWMWTQRLILNIIILNIMVRSIIITIIITIIIIIITVILHYPPTAPPLFGVSCRDSSYFDMSMKSAYFPRHFHRYNPI